MTKSCSTCEHFAPSGSRDGTCRGALPRMRIDHRGEWPWVNRDDWCSLHKLKDARAVAVILGKPELV